MHYSSKESRTGASCLHYVPTAYSLLWVSIIYTNTGAILLDAHSVEVYG